MGKKKKIPEGPLGLKGLFECSYLDATLPQEQRLGEKEIMFKKMALHAEVEDA